MKHKILSFLTALAMVLGIVVQPFATANAAEENISTAANAVTEKVTLHKLMMTKDELKNWTQLTEEKYDGTQNTQAILGTLGQGHSAKEVAGVYFALKFAADYEDTALQGKYVKASTTDKLTPANPLAGTDNVDEAVGGLTTANGIDFKTSDLKGKFEIDEITNKSTYKGDDGEEITDWKAVPVKITLPLVNSKGTVVNAHVYPKNTQEKPEIDKNFGKENNTTDNNKDNDLKHAEGFEAAADGAGAKAGAQYKNYQVKKETAMAEIGKVVPYEVRTKIPAKSKLKSAKWDDKMTEGLTYQKDIVLTIGTEKYSGNTLKGIATLTETDNGFVLDLNEEGLKLINNQDKDVEVYLQYTAKVNSNAVVDIPESNDVMFHYGNKPSKSTTPIPTNPKDQKITVKKTWGEGEGWEAGESATFKLYDANTGEEVPGSEVTLNQTKTTHTWENLDDTKEYIAVETNREYLHDAEYKEGEDGEILVTNHKTDNPKPLNPTEPKVVNGGKKFVKTNDKEKGATDLVRLAGAEFYIKNNANQYLVAAKTDATAVTNAKKALDEAVAAYNKLTAKQQESQEGTTAKNLIDEKQKAYNEAFIANANAYTWGNKTDENVVVVTSDAQGRFEIQGLQYGSYKLEEKTAPKDYAKIADQDFTIAKGSYAGDAKELQYNEADANNGYGQQVKNKKVTIPETGGIGSLIFVVAGIAIMGLAAYKMKANKQEA